jgi:hypothetical protein
MANASRSHFGSGAHGKGSGAGAMTNISHDEIGENAVLSNRDKKLHGDGRGADSAQVQNDQLRDHAANRLGDDPEV